MDDYENHKTYILGISCFYHDSAAVLLCDGEVIAAAQEERFTRIKHDESFPSRATDFCLQQAGISVEELDYVIFYDKPLLKFERILQTYIVTWPLSFLSFLKAIPIWLKTKLWIKQTIEKELNYSGPVLFSEHHTSHAASSFFSSVFKEATVITIDGVGEWETTTIGCGNNGNFAIKESIHFPDSLGLLYSALTYYLGFKVNSGEYKVMGLAPYGDPKKYYNQMKKLIKLHEDGSFSLDQKYFSYMHGLKMTSSAFNKLFGGKPRNPETEVTQKEKDIAASLQMVLEEAVLGIVRHAHDKYPSDNLCLAGGVALNCVANEKVLKLGPFTNVYIQPASGDAGGALGAAQYLWHTVLGNAKKNTSSDVYLGPEFSDQEILSTLQDTGVRFNKVEESQTADETAKLLSLDYVIGWFQGRMEFGPRALGNRSIIADARNKQNWQRVNLKIKFRESFRPFAPSVLEGRSIDYFDLDTSSPFMLLTAPVKNGKVPAVTHVDGSARLQTVSREQNKKYYELISAFDNITGCPVIINTSFNVRGEPIVCTPEDAIKCFLNTDMDYLVLGNYLISKKDNLHLVDGGVRDEYLEKFELD